MTLSRAAFARRSTVITCAAALICATAPAAGAATAGTEKASSAQTSAQPATLLGELAAAGKSSGSGTFTSSDGVTGALQRQVADAGTESGAAAAKYPKCRGTFKHAVADVTLQESMKHGIPWIVKLRKANSKFGVINFSAQIYANNHQANVYQPHVEPWNYQFHGPLPRPFSVVKSSKKYTMPRGATVSFLWTWYSVAKPTQGAYRYVNCTFKP